MNEDKLEQAVLLYKQGNKPQAARLLGEIVRQDPNNSNAWYGLALSLDEKDKKIFCLKKVLTLEPSHQKAIQLLEQLQTEQKSSVFIQEKTTKSVQPVIQKPASKNPIKKTIEESTPIEKKLIYVLVGMLALLVICVSVVGVTTWTRQQCTNRFENEMASLLSQFFRQQSIAEVTARINLPEQISRLEDIRTTAWNMPDKTCQPKAHSLIMNYMDLSISAYVAFSGEEDTLSYDILDQSIEALSELDDEVIKTFDKGGLVSLFRSKGYFYWEGLDNPQWKNQVDG